MVRYSIKTSKIRVGAHGEVTTTQAGTIPTVQTRRIGVKPKIGYVVLENPDLANECMTFLWRMIQRANDLEEMFSYCISFVIHVLPELDSPFKQAFEDANFDIYEMHYPSDANFVQYEYLKNGDHLETNELLSLVGLILLAPFKNPTSANCDMFFNSRLEALCGILGTNAKKLTILFNLKKAMYIRNRFNQVKDAKRAIVSFIISPLIVQEVTLSSMIEYVSGIIAWSDMTTYHFILNTLVRTGSPVLYHPDVLPETETLCAAIRTISVTSHPQFFRYFGNIEDQKFLSRSNYPILFPVAVSIQSKKFPNAKFLAATNKIDASLLNGLVRVHEEYANSDFKIPLTLMEYEPMRISHGLRHNQVTRKVLNLDRSALSVLSEMEEFERRQEKREIDIGDHESANVPESGK